MKDTWPPCPTGPSRTTSSPKDAPAIKMVPEIPNANFVIEFIQDDRLRIAFCQEERRPCK